MTASSAQWQLERLSAEAREAAEVTALKQGAPLATWLARLIIETSAAEGVELSPERPREPAAREGGLSVVAVAAPSPSPLVAPANPPILKPAITIRAPSRPAVAAPSVTSRPAPAVAPNPFTLTPAISIAAAPVAPPASAPVTPVASAPAAPPSTKTGEPQSSLDFAGTVVMLPIDALEPSGCGTRRADDQVPSDLIMAIATDGLQRPLLVRRRRGSGDRYEIIAGARRWQAAQRIGLTQLPAIVTDLDDAQAVLASLNENLHRGDLPPLDEARAYLRLLTQFSLNAVEVTKTISRDRQHIVRLMRLLGLPPRVRSYIDAGQISTDHAFLLLGAADAEQLGNVIANEGLSLAETRRRLDTTTATERSA